MSESIDEEGDRVESREDFIRFVLHLSDNYLEEGQKWENPTLDRYLDALAAWTEGMDQNFKNRRLPVPEAPSWALFAQILLAATQYE